MYAVIETGGKQYRVEVGTELEVELLEVETGQSITLDRVLLVADGAEAAVGQPLVSDAVVAADVLRQTRGEKLISFKYRPKARSRVKKGHRQELTVLRISDITFGGRSAAEDARAAAELARTERERIQEAASRQAAADAELAARLASQTKAAEPPAPKTGRGTRAAKPEAATKAKAGPEPASDARRTLRPKAAAKPPAEAGPASADAKPRKARTTKKDG